MTQIEDLVIKTSTKGGWNDTNHRFERKNLYQRGLE